MTSAFEIAGAMDARAEAARARIRGLWAVVGDTPMVVVRCRVRDRELCVYAKLESENFTGSIKDRMALYMLDAAYAQRAIEPYDVIVEASSGNTGISFAALGRALGHDVRVYMPDWMSSERRAVIASLGCEIVSVSKPEGGFRQCIALADRFALDHGHAFRPQQFSNRANIEAHRRTTGVEILAQLSARDLEPTAFVAGVGTGGTVMGVGAALRARVPGVAIHPLEPANSPTLRTGFKVGQHRIAGISDEFVPPIIDLSSLDPVIDVWDGDAILMAQKLARELGLAVGISSGANFLGALEVALRQGPHAVVTTVFPDSNKKYLSTDLCRIEPVRDGYLSREVELLDFSTVPRAGCSLGETCTVCRGSSAEF